MLSVVTPAYREEQNLPQLYQRLRAALGRCEWEWVVVDDHSQDGTFAAIADLAAKDARIRGVRLSRNFGSHAAILCGLERSRGNAVVVIAADMEEPPEILPKLIAEWKNGFQVVWGIRSQAAGVASSAYHRMMRRMAGIEHIPDGGPGCFLIDRTVVSALATFGERHNNLFVLLAWMGFRQSSVTYERAVRTHGRSGWSMSKKIELLLDSVTAFSYKPIRWMSLIGAVTAVAGFLWAGEVLVNALKGNPPQGFSSLMVAVLIVGGVQMLMMGVLGEYLWRALDESRRRPRYVVEDATRDLD